MPLLTLDQARDQCRVDGTQDDVALAQYSAAAEAAAVAYLNRAVFVDQGTLDAAQDAVPGALAAAGQAFDTAMTAADDMTDTYQQQAARDVAAARFDAAMLAANRTIHGMVVNPAILAAIQLLLGHLYSNREDVLTGLRAAAVAVPNGAQDLMRLYRRTMMP